MAADLRGMRRLVLAALVIAVAGAAFGWHGRAAARERHLGEVATQLARRPVKVRCQSWVGSLFDVSDETGSVRFDAHGVPADHTDLKRSVCKALQRFPRDWPTPAYGCVVARTDCPPAIREDVLAVKTLAHEVWHLRGYTNEAVTECRGLQTTAQAARLLGADSRTAQATAAYAYTHLYPLLPADYRTTDCRDGGPDDLRPDDPVFP